MSYFEPARVSDARVVECRHDNIKYLVFALFQQKLGESSNLFSGTWNYAYLGWLHRAGSGN